MEEQDPRDENHDLYQYEQLQHHDSIRILKLNPAVSSDEELSGGLIYARLEDTLEYEAISYTWGEPEYPDTLYLGRVCLKITANLAAALRSLRFSDHPRLLWADAVCINQKSIEERNHQVELMSDLYKRACTVICWLGEPSPRTETAIAAYEKLARGSEVFGVQRGDTWLQFEQSELEGPEELKSGLLQWAAFSGMQDIYERLYFSRLWIIQEVSLAENPVLYCGPHKMEWVVFATAMLVLSRVLTGRYGIIVNSGAFFRAWSLVDARAEFRMNQLPNFISLLNYSSFGYFLTVFNHHECKDEHDRVYALLGFQKPDSPIKVIPNYAKPVFQLYKEINRQFLATGELEVLYAAGLCHLKEELRDLRPDHIPSWAIEYRPSHRVEFRSPVSRNVFTAATDRRPRLAISPEDTVANIAVQGLMVCVVSSLHVDKPHRTPYTFLKTIAELLSLCRDIYAHSDLTTYAFGDNEDVSLAAFRTLLSDGSDTDVDLWLQTNVRRNMMQLWKTYSTICLEPDGEISTLAAEAMQNAYPIEPAWYDDVFYSTLSTEAKLAWQCHKMLCLALCDKAFVITQRGMFGLVPDCQKEGDIVALFDGMEVPVLLRPVLELSGDLTLHQLVGTCYFHGIMYGETCIEALDDQRRLFNII
jgi:hypothetical protein